MSQPLVLSLACTALLSACAPAILSVQVEPAQPPAQSAFVVEASISTTGASGSPALRITQDLPAPAAEFGPATVTTDSAASGNLRVSTVVPSGALRPSQNYGASMKVTVSVPWQDLLSNTHYVSASVPVIVGAPANCKSFDDPGQTQGWRLRGFERVSVSSPADVTALSAVGPGLAWVSTENYPGPLHHRIAQRLPQLQKFHGRDGWRIAQHAMA